MRSAFLEVNLLLKKLVNAIEFSWQCFLEKCFTCLIVVNVSNFSFIIAEVLSCYQHCVSSAISLISYLQICTYVLRICLHDQYIFLALVIEILLRWNTHLHMTLFPSVLPSYGRLSIGLSVRSSVHQSSVYPSVAHHISGTVHHVIMIFGTQV